MRRPACAPPPKIWISGNGSDDLGVAASVLPQRHAARRRRSLRDGERRRHGGVATQAGLVRVSRRARSSVVSTASWSHASSPASAPAIAPLTLAIARCYVDAAEKAPPSRRSTASREPRDAPGRRDRASGRAAGQRDFRFDGRASARIPDAAALHPRNRWSCLLTAAQASAIAAARRRAPPMRPARNARDWHCGRRSSVRYSTGDLPSTRASISAGKSAAMRAVQRGPRFPVDVRVGRPSTSAANAASIALAPVRAARRPSTAGDSARTRQSNAGSPYHAHSASRITGPSAPIEDVLRAEIAVNQHALAWCAWSRRSASELARARSGCARAVATR